MAYCPNCANAVPLDAQTCSRCGALFGATSDWKPSASRRGQPPLWRSADYARLLAAFALAPVIPILLFTLLMFPGRHFLFFLGMTAIGAYGIAIVLGLPTFISFRTYESGLTHRKVLLISFLITAFPALFLGLMAPGASVGRRLWEILGLPLVVGLLGVLGGYIFWAIAKPALKTDPEGAIEV